MLRSVIALVLTAGLLSASPHLDAQSYPRVRVQLTPLCNVLTIGVVEDDRGLAAAGFDDRCGAGTPTPVAGRAVRQDDGTLRMALYVRDGRAVQLVSLELEVSGRTGTWQDTAGRAGVAAPPGAMGRRRPSPTAPHAGPSHGAERTLRQFGRAFHSVVPDPPAGVGTNFFPEFICTYGREFLGFQGSEILCSDVITPVASGAADMALGSDGHPVFVGSGAVTHCGDPACSAGNTAVVLNTVTSGGRIAIGYDGLPVIAQVSGGALTITKCDDRECTSGMESTVAPLESVSSLVIGSDSLPLVVGASAGLVRVIHCGDATCTSGHTTVDLPLQHATTVEPKVAIAPNGLPVIAFRYDVPLPYPQVEDGVKIHFCADHACSTGSTSAPVMSNTLSQNNKFCCGLSLAIGSDGLPIVASHRMFWGLWAAHCDDGVCGVSSSSSKNDDGTLPGLSVDLMIGARGVPVMSHHGGNDWKLKVTECRDVACTGFGHPTTTMTVGAINEAIVLGSEGLPIVVGGGQVVACGTKGCQTPALGLTPEPGPMSLPPRGR